MSGAYMPGLVWLGFVLSAGVAGGKLALDVLSDRRKSKGLR